MDPKLRRKLIVSGVGVAIFIALVAAAYIFVLSPRLKVWREAREEIGKRQTRLDELRKKFANQKNPQDEIAAVEQEIKNLRATIQQLEKVKTPGTETTSLPKELNDPEEAIRRELYKDYMKQVMDVAGGKIKERLKTAQISPPDLVLYEDLEQADEVAYYMNRAAGLQGIINALAKSRSPESILTIDNLAMEKYAEGIKRREGAVNVLSYLLKTTMDTQTLISFLYNLRDESGFYYIESMEIKPGKSARGSSPQLSVEARIDTTMIFKSQVEIQVRTVIAQASKPAAKAGGGGGGWMAEMAMAMKAEAERAKNRPKKKWYEFWKKE